MKRKNKILFLAITLTAMLILVTSVNAANTTDHNTDNTISEKTSTPATSEIKETTINKEKIKTSKNTKMEEKTINKTDKREKQSKTTTQTIEVNNFEEFTNSINEINLDTRSDKYIINFNEGTYKFTSNTDIISEKNIQINGNNQIFTADRKLRLITFNCTSLEINDLTFSNCRCNVEGRITLNNIKYEYLFSVRPYSNCDINNCNFQGTTTIPMENSKTTIKNSILNSTTNVYGTLIADENTILGENFKLELSNTGKIITNNTELKKWFNENPYEGNVEVNDENISENITIPTTGNITFTNCQINAKITNNGNLTLVNCSLSNNKMTTSGSKTDGFLIENNGNLTMIDCVVENNTFNTTLTQLADRNHLYGAITNSGLMTIINSTFINNSVGYALITDKDDDYSYDYGIDMGEASCIYNKGLLNINNSIFKNNYAGRHAGSIYSTNKTNITRTQFINNTATRCGGALLIQNGTYNLNETKFINNTILISINIGTTGIYAGNAIYIGVINSQVERDSYNNITINNSYFEENNLKRIASSGYASSSNTIIYCFKNTGEINIDNTTFKNQETLLSGGNNKNTQSITNSQFINFLNYPFDGYFEKLVNNTYTNTSFPRASAQLIENNTYINIRHLVDTIELNIPKKIYTGEPITITGNYTTPFDNNDPEIYKHNKFQIYINEQLNQTVDTLEFTITPTNNTMIIEVKPTISQTSKIESIRATTLTDIIITPENYNEYIYKGTLLNLNKDTKIIFKGTFNNKGEIFIDTPDIVIDGSDATFTNTIFKLEATGITLQNMKINNTQTQYPIQNTKDNNIITGNTITLTNTEGKTATIYNAANNTEIIYNTLLVDGPALGIDYTTGLGVANTQAILLLGGNENIIEYNNIKVTSTGTSNGFGTIEGITNHNEANNSIIRYNNITIDGNGKFNYAINTLSNVKGININNNNIYVTGERYTAGIQAGNGAQKIIIDNNNIKCVCINNTPVDEEAITYGIITTNMGSGISNNINITNNNIDLTGSVNYGIEVYQTTNTILENNTINVKGSQSMGIGYAHSPNSTITHNTIKTSGDSTIPLTQVTEEIKQANVGIQIQQESDNILVEDNTIQTYDIGAEDTCINIDSLNVTVKDNDLTSSNKVGDDTIKTTQPDTIIDNNNAIEQESSTQTITEDLTIGDSTALTAQFYDDTYTPAGDGKAIFKVNGKTLRDNQGNVIYADVINGRAELPDVNITQEWMKPDTTIQAVYVGDNNNEPITTTPTTINVTKPEATITLEAPTEATAGTTITLKATVTDGENNINSGRVAFKLNGKTLKDPKTGKALYANVENGVATIQYTIPEKTKAKEYVLTAVFTDNKYDRKETNSTLNVVKA